MVAGADRRRREGAYHRSVVTEHVRNVFCNDHLQRRGHEQFGKAQIGFGLHGCRRRVRPSVNDATRPESRLAKLPLFRSSQPVLWRAGLPL
jgi:hypothetical protein